MQQYNMETGGARTILTGDSRAVVTGTGARLKDRHLFQQTWWDSFLGHTCVEDYW